MYEYFIAMLLIFILWLIIFFFFKKIRKIILYNGLLYVGLLIPLFWLHKLLKNFFNISEMYNPAYWYPNTLFNLNNITSGCGIEDALFMFLFGGIVAIIYDLVTKNKIEKTQTLLPYLPISIFLISYILLSFTKINPIYLLIIPSFLGAIALIIIRKDLIKNAVYSSILFTLFYFIAFLIFNQIFPYFVNDFYNQNAISFFVLGVPFEDILYALSFSMMWAPMYKFIKGYK